MTPERGLFDSDEDLAAYLARMTTAPEPKQFNYEHSFSPNMQARINAEVQPAFRDAPQVFTPQIGATLGPLSLNGGLQIQQATNDQGNPYTKLAPTFGAGLKVPLPGDATGEAKFTYTPEQLKVIEAAYRRKLLGGDLDLTLRHSQPIEGRPDTYVGARYSRSF
jgi:hypothetical protein